MAPFQNFVRWYRLPTKMAAKLKIEKRGWNKKNIFSSETTEPISTKLCWNDSWMVPFQNCVRWSGHLAYRTVLSDTILKGTHPGTIHARFRLIWFSSFRGEDLNVIFYQNTKFELYKHNDELFSIYYRIFFYVFWTFADFDRLCKLEKRGDFYFELGGHLGWKSGSPDTILEGDHPRIISAKIGWDWPSSFRGEFNIYSAFFCEIFLQPIYTDYAN
jgi:hypothetical protein